MPNFNDIVTQCRAEWKREEWKTVLSGEKTLTYLRYEDVRKMHINKG